jgi:hypothetical protein
VNRRDEVRRRALLAAGGRAMVAAVLASAGLPRGLFAGEAGEHGSSSDGLEQRLAEAIEAYDAQGNHRTATAVDNGSAEWLTRQIRQSGVEPSLESFPLSRIDPLSSYLRVAGRRIEGVPLFDGGFTGPEGVHGTLGPLDSGADIVLVETEPFTLIEPRKELGGPVPEARRGPHKGVIILTRGSRPGLFVLNAPSFNKPFGPPALQISSAESEWLKARAQERAEVSLIAHAARTAAQANNVTARIAGSDPDLAPLVVTTPRSGWWECASERGGGLACWLEAIGTLAAAKPARDCLFAAFSGHEVGFLGIDAYLMPRPDLAKRAHAWIHIGANIGAPRQPNQVNVSDSLESWFTAALRKEGLTIDNKAPPGSIPRGEAGTIHRSGARYVALVTGTEVFHNTADRWPDAVDIAVVARYARAIAAGAVELAQQRS